MVYTLHNGWGLKDIFKLKSPAVTMLLVLLHKWAPQFLSGMLSELGGWWNKPTNHYSASFYVFLKNGKCPNIGQFLYNGRFVQQYFSKSKHSDVMYYLCTVYSFLQYKKICKTASMNNQNYSSDVQDQTVALYTITVLVSHALHTV